MNWVVAGIEPPARISRRILAGTGFINQHLAALATPQTSLSMAHSWHIQADRRRAAACTRCASRAANVGIHTLAMLVVATVIAFAVYEWVGLAFPRRDWFNLDLLWAFALIGVGAILLATSHECSYDTTGEFGPALPL